MLKDKGHIFLTGMMGSGKSAVGQYLAEILRCPFTDLDREIEKRSGKTIPEIFREDGEAAFRQWESRVAQEFRPGVPCVVAVGGGFPLKKEHRRWMKARGKVIWLKAPPAILRERVRDSKRPLLPEPLREADIEKILRERVPLYAEADLSVDTEERDPRQVAEDIMMKVL